MKNIITILLVVSTLLTSCKSAIDKSVSEPLSNEELVSICKDIENDDVIKFMTLMGSKESLIRTKDNSPFIKHADVTYRDLLDFMGTEADSTKIEELNKRYDLYVNDMVDSMWTKISAIREEIKNDTSFNRYAKLSYKVIEKKPSSLSYNQKTRKKVVMDLDERNDSISEMGGIVSKVSKEGAENPIIDFNFFVIEKSKYGYYTKQDPTYDNDTIDFVSGEFDYSINILWVKKGNEKIFTSEDNWKLLSSKTNNSIMSIYYGSSRPVDRHFQKKTANDNVELRMLTNTKIKTRKAYKDSVYYQELPDRLKGAVDLIKDVM